MPRDSADRLRVDRGSVAGFAASMEGVIQDLAQRTSHGTPGGLTLRQRQDLAELVLSIDGNTTAAELRSAVAGDRGPA